MMEIKGVVFDFNGVLLWDSALHEAAWRTTAVELRGTEFTDTELVHQVHGRTNADIFTHLLGRTPGNAELNDLIQLKERRYRSLCLANSKIFLLSPGSIDLLNWMITVAVPFTIATSSDWSNVSFFINHLRLDRWFDIDKIVFDDGKIRGKPAPDMYLVAAGKIGVAPGECAVVEDSASGVQAAFRAGYGQVIGLAPQRLRERLIASTGVDLIIESLESFPRERLVLA